MRKLFFTIFAAIYANLCVSVEPPPLPSQLVYTPQEKAPIKLITASKFDLSKLTRVVKLNTTTKQTSQSATPQQATPSSEATSDKSSEEKNP